MEKYVCVLSTNNYLEGVLVLNENLKALKSKYPLLCLINENISKETIRKLKLFHIDYKLIPSINFNCKTLYNWKYTFDKINVDRKSTRLNSSHSGESRMPSSA